MRSEPPPTLDYAAMYTQGYPVLLGELRRRMNQHTGATISRDLIVSMDGLSADDLAQEAWARAWRHWPQTAGQPRERVFAWVFTIARNLLIDRQRRQQRGRRLGQRQMTADLWNEAQDAVPDPRIDTQPEAVALSHAGYSELRALIERTVTAQRFHQPARALAHLSAYANGLSDKAIAQQMGITTRVIRMERWRMRQALQARIKQEQQEGVAS
jgi:RNA polymerase sigma factor (sigma-70 family)